MIAALALSLFAPAAITRLTPFRPSPTPAAPAAQSQPGLRLSKEYIYAGGRLVATEEPGAAPAAPTNLKNVKGVKKSVRQLVWEDNSDSESGFKVERRPFSYDPAAAAGAVPLTYGPWGVFGTTGPNVTSYGLPADCDFDYRVRAFNGSGDSTPSNEVGACYYHTLDQNAPTNLIATAQLGSQVALTWTPPAAPVARYEVERSQSTSGAFERLLPDPTSPAFTDAGASPGTAYLYRVRAVLVDETVSAYSNEDLATTVIFSPVRAGVTLIQARHLNERRQAVNAVRALAGLGPAAWTYPDPVSGPHAQRRKVYFEDVWELRTRLDEALLRLGRFEPYPADPPLARGALIRAALFTQISARVE